MMDLFDKRSGTGMQWISRNALLFSLDVRTRLLRQSHFYRLLPSSYPVMSCFFEPRLLFVAQQKSVCDKALREVKLLE